MSTKKVAVVTGSNKGIGLEIVKGLCKKFDGIVYLTARDVERGEAAVKKLNEMELRPLFHQLDITDQESVNRFRDYIKTTHGGIDLLINNAGVGFEGDKQNYAANVAKTIGVNYYGTLRVSEALFPLLRQNAKVVNVSSAVGFLMQIKSPELRAKFGDKSLTLEKLSQLMEDFIEAARKGDISEWSTPYRVSKVGMSALSIIHHKMLDSEVPNRNIKLNFVHPGYVRTDMTGHQGKLNVDEGAKSTLYCALEADFKGKYVWYDNQIVDWYGPDTPPF